MKAAPVISFERVKVGSKIKGYLKFVGFGFVARAEQLTEFPVHGPSFENFRFQLRFLQPHSETLLDWEWISARRNRTLSDEDCLRHAVVMANGRTRWLLLKLNEGALGRFCQ